jgi:hypothetical protein
MNFLLKCSSIFLILLIAFASDLNRHSVRSKIIHMDTFTAISHLTIAEIILLISFIDISSAIIFKYR